MGNLGKIGKPQKSKKHKKLKPVDPFNRSGRRAAAEAAKKADKTPKAKQIDDQEITRSMREFIRNKKMMEDQLNNPKKNEKMKDGKMNDYQSNDDRRGMKRPMRKVPEFHRKKGERDRHFIGRAEKAARDVIGESRFEDKYKLNANPTEEEQEEKKKKKEEWKTKKAARKEKRKKKRKGEDVSDEILALHKKNKEEADMKRKIAAEADAAASSAESPSTRSREWTDFSDLKDVVEFGEVALAPPTLTAKPRKAEAKDQRRNNLLLSAIVNDHNTHDDGSKVDQKRTNKGKNDKGGYGKSRPEKKTQKLKNLSALQKSNLLNERQKVVDKYRKLRMGNLGKL